jgi:hypothetical protein
VIEQRFRRTWHPDQQVAPERVLETLRARRLLATTDEKAIPWMSSVDIAASLGMLRDQRWNPPGGTLPPLADPTVCHRKTPNGCYWHPVTFRDIRAALNHYEAEGTIVRLPHPLATWGVDFFPLDATDRDAMVSAWLEMDAARENARHAQRMHRLSAGRRAAGAA